MTSDLVFGMEYELKLIQICFLDQTTYIPWVYNMKSAVLEIVFCISTILNHTDNSFDVANGIFILKLISLYSPE